MWRDSLVEPQDCGYPLHLTALSIPLLFDTNNIKILSSTAARDPNGTNILKLTISFWDMGTQAAMLGDAHFDADRQLALLNYTLQGTPKDKGGSNFMIVGSNSYQPTAKRFPTLQRMTKRVYVGVDGGIPRDGSLTLDQAMEFTYIDPANIRDEDFTLSAYNLPEPLGKQYQAQSWLPIWSRWLLLIAPFLLALLYFVIRNLSRRS